MMEYHIGYAQKYLTYLPLVGLMVFNLAHSSGIGPVTWIITGTPE